ncbi:MAG: hypothetical protein V3T49_06445, partial [Dehalococcoidia bacterium]
MFDRLNRPESRPRQAEPVLAELSAVFSFFLNSPNSVGSSFFYFFWEPVVRYEIEFALSRSSASLAASRSASIFLDPEPIATGFESITTSIVKISSLCDP